MARSVLASLSQYMLSIFRTLKVVVDLLNKQKESIGALGVKFMNLNSLAVGVRKIVDMNRALLAKVA